MSVHCRNLKWYYDLDIRVHTHIYSNYYYFDHRKDVFARVGGASYERNVSTDAMIVLHSGNIIGDNIWLWRAGEAVAHVFSNDDA